MPPGHVANEIADGSGGARRSANAALRAAGCDVIRAEKASGTRRDGRTELQAPLGFLRRGTTLVVTRLGDGNKTRM